MRSCTFFLPLGFKHGAPSNHFPCLCFACLSQNSFISLLLLLLKTQISAILWPDCDKSHMHSQTKTEIEVVPAVKNVPVYPNCGVFLSLVFKSVYTPEKETHHRLSTQVHTGLFPCELYNMKLFMVFIGKGKGCLGYPLSPPADLGCAAHLDALQRDTDFPQVLCALPVSADVLDTLWCLTGCEMFLFQVLIHHRIPVPWALGCGTQLFNHSALRAVTQSKHRCETGRIFPPVSQSPPVQQSGAFGGISGWLCCSFSSVLE